MERQSPFTKYQSMAKILNTMVPQALRLATKALETTYSPRKSKYV